VYGLDMFYNVFKRGRLEDDEAKDVCHRFIEYVLKPGASQNELDMLRRFIGREPSMAAFYEEFSFEMSGGTLQADVDRATMKHQA